MRIISGEIFKVIDVSANILKMNHEEYIRYIVDGIAEDYLEMWQDDDSWKTPETEMMMKLDEKEIKRYTDSKMVLDFPKDCAEKLIGWAQEKNVDVSQFISVLFSHSFMGVDTCTSKKPPWASMASLIWVLVFS